MSWMDAVADMHRKNDTPKTEPLPAPSIMALVEADLDAVFGPDDTQQTAFHVAVPVVIADSQAQVPAFAVPTTVEDGPWRMPSWGRFYMAGPTDKFFNEIATEMIWRKRASEEEIRKSVKSKAKTKPKRR